MQRREARAQKQRRANYHSRGQPHTTLGSPGLGACRGRSMPSSRLLLLGTLCSPSFTSIRVSHNSRPLWRGKDEQYPTKEPHYREEQTFIFCFAPLLMEPPLRPFLQMPLINLAIPVQSTGGKKKTHNIANSTIG